MEVRTMPDEPVHAVVEVPTLQAVARVPTPGIQITTHLWLVWRRVAVENLGRCSAARSAGDLGDETAYGMVAICASAFAMEGLLGAWTPLAMPAETIAAWSRPGNKTKASERVLQVLKHSMVDQRKAEELASHWPPVLESRGDAAHFLEAPKAPVPHPSGTNTSPEDERYCLENGRAAVHLLRETHEAVASHPKPKIRGWAEAQAHVAVLWSDVEGF
jgi:hypothetical protein